MDGYGLRAGGDTSGGLDGNEIEVHIFLGIFVIVLRCSYLGLVHNFLFAAFSGRVAFFFLRNPGRVAC
jgi:hypothetical protein